MNVICSILSNLLCFDNLWGVDIVLFMIKLYLKMRFNMGWIIFFFIFCRKLENLFLFWINGKMSLLSGFLKE